MHKNQKKTKVQQVYTNDKIKAKWIIVIWEDWEKLGKMQRQEALDLAEEKWVDLVQLSYDRDTMTCTAKLMDYGKFLYEQKKKEKNQKKWQSKWTKEIRIAYATWENDILRKVEKWIELLKEWYILKILLQVKWRERLFEDIAVEKLKNIVSKLEEYWRPQFWKPKQEKKWYYMMLSPLSKKK